MADLTDQESLGLTLFNGKAMCENCHLSEPGPNGEPPLFTDFTHDNLGVPKNPDNPFYSMPRKWNPNGENWIDPGLGGFLANAGYWSPPSLASPVSSPLDSHATSHHVATADSASSLSMTSSKLTSI